MWGRGCLFSLAWLAVQRDRKCRQTFPLFRFPDRHQSQWYSSCLCHTFDYKRNERKKKRPEKKEINGIDSFDQQMKNTEEKQRLWKYYGVSECVIAARFRGNYLSVVSPPSRLSNAEPSLELWPGPGRGAWKAQGFSVTSWLTDSFTYVCTGVVIGFLVSCGAEEIRSPWQGVPVLSVNGQKWPNPRRGASLPTAFQRAALAEALTSPEVGQRWRMLCEQCGWFTCPAWRCSVSNRRRVGFVLSPRAGAEIPRCAETQHQANWSECSTGMANK